MRTVIGFESAKKLLLENRGLNLSDTASSISKSSEKIFGRKMSALEYVETIINEVRIRGDEGLKSVTKKIEGRDITQFYLDKDEPEKAYERIDESLRSALESTADRVKSFHSKVRDSAWTDESEGYGLRTVPVTSAAAYVPGGTAKYPSTVLMTAIPAKVAGVSNVAIASPPTVSGLLPDSVLASAFIAGVDQIYPIGGAQAIAALSYGTESVQKVDVICGPGNIFVTLAKKLVYGDVGIDGLYGPTETVVLADETSNATLCAADLIAQAEHDPMAKPVLITTSKELGDRVAAELIVRLQTLERADIIETSLKTQGLIAIVEDINEGIDLANVFAPEHLCIATKDPRSLLPQVKNAGMVFLGEFSHEVLGDYGAGPSHVMPTAGTARFNSGLGIHTFTKHMPVVSLPSHSAIEMTESVSVLAREEGLTGHAEAAEIRRELI